MKWKVIVIVMAIMLSVFGNPAMASDNVLMVKEDLNIPVPCVLYKGVEYGSFTLLYATPPIPQQLFPKEPEGMFWNMPIITKALSPNTYGSCIPVDDKQVLNLTILPIFPVKYQDIERNDTVYDIQLHTYPAQDNPPVVYLKMDSSKILVLDALDNYVKDVVKAQDTGDVNLQLSRTSKIILPENDYQCMVEYIKWYYDNYNDDNVNLVINNVIYEKNNEEKMLAKLNSTRTYTRQDKKSLEKVDVFFTSEETLIFEDGMWKYYGNDNFKDGRWKYYNDKAYPDPYVWKIAKCAPPPEPKLVPAIWEYSFSFRCDNQITAVFKRQVNESESSFVFVEKNVKDYNDDLMDVTMEVAGANDSAWLDVNVTSKFPSHTSPESCKERKDTLRAELKSNDTEYTMTRVKDCIGTCNLKVTIEKSKVQ